MNTKGLVGLKESRGDSKIVKGKTYNNVQKVRGVFLSLLCGM